jgi:hypothetical protein
MTIRRNIIITGKEYKPKRDHYSSFSNRNDKSFVCMHSFWGIIETHKHSEDMEGYSKVGSIQCNRNKCKYVHIKVQLGDGRHGNMCSFGHFESKEFQIEEETKLSVANGWDMFRRGILSNRSDIYNQPNIESEMKATWHKKDEQVQPKLGSKSKDACMKPSNMKTKETQVSIPMQTTTVKNDWGTGSLEKMDEKVPIIEIPNPLVWSDLENEPIEFYKW